MEFLAIGTLVTNPQKPEWGPGKVLRVSGEIRHVFFRDLAGRTAKRFKVGSLEPAAIQSDPVLDNLPPFRDEHGQLVLPHERLTLDQATRRFLKEYPLGFHDPQYLADGKAGERGYKWQAHELYQQTLGGGAAEDLLSAGGLDKLDAFARRGDRQRQPPGRARARCSP